MCILTLWRLCVPTMHIIFSAIMLLEMIPYSYLFIWWCHWNFSCHFLTSFYRLILPWYVIAFLYIYIYEESLSWHGNAISGYMWMFFCFVMANIITGYSGKWVKEEEETQSPRDSYCDLHHETHRSHILSQSSFLRWDWTHCFSWCDLNIFQMITNLILDKLSCTL